MTTNHDPFMDGYDADRTFPPGTFQVSTGHPFDTETFEERRDRIMRQADEIEWDLRRRRADRISTGFEDTDLAGFPEAGDEDETLRWR